jgi:hypothetical protein
VTLPEPERLAGSRVAPDIEVLDKEAAVNANSEATRLREIAERCDRIAASCFDLTAAARLREVATEIRATAANLSLASGMRREGRTD